MKFDSLASRGLRTVLALGLVGAVSACASSGPQKQVQAPPPPAAPQYHAPQHHVQPAPPPSYAAKPPAHPTPPPSYAAQPPAQPAPVPPTAEKPAFPAEHQVAIGGTAFPVDGSAGRVPEGSRLVVRVYDAAGGNVNVRVAEEAFSVTEGLPARYKVPVPESALIAMELPAVAARVESPRNRVIYRNETAVLLKNGAAGDIPMTLQRKVAASAVTREWTAPAVK